MTREEAAAILKRSVEELNDVLDGVTMSEGPKAAIQRYIDAYSMAVDALLEKVDVKIEKPWAPIAIPVETVGVEISRGWHKAYIALGSKP